MPESLTYACVCFTGYRGVYCDQQISPCESNPCKYGTCSINTCKGCTNQTTGGYACQCAAGYTGTNCDQKINACNLLNPCKNGAKCYEMSGLNYLCACSTGFTGNSKQNFNRKIFFNVLKF